MLPLQQAYEVKESVLEYIKATFRFKDKDVYDEFYRFIEDPSDGMFKGPYVSLKTPFIKATPEEQKNISLDIVPPFAPHKHQLQAFSKLTTHNGHKPEPTLLTTGTGSGKTECFLFPILDYCYQCNKDGHRDGVKVIIMYPMNALASDQAKRLAETIWNDEHLKGKVTAGLFIGEGEDPQNYPSVMGEENVIEKRSAILDTVPDILLTNFKMLDYALMKQEFRDIWKGNIDTDNPALKFIILDELHTYDGAQGTDVANLIRRLKLKLDLPSGWLCPVGTSATIGNGAGSKSNLCNYATDVFGELFREKDVIEEHRVPVYDFFGGVELIEDLPSENELHMCRFLDNDDVDSYVDRVRKTWLPSSTKDPLSIADGLHQLRLLKDILECTSKGIITINGLSDELARLNAKFRALTTDLRNNTIESILALVAQAKTGDKHPMPMLYLQIQLWQRELSGILRYVQEKPEFTWRDKQIPEGRVALPMYFCRDCGASGWLSRRLKTDTHFSTNISEINTAFVQTHDKEVCLINLDTKHHEPVDEYLANRGECWSMYVNTWDLSDSDEGEDGSLRIKACRKLTMPTSSGNQHFSSNCPECNGEALAIVGGRTSTLSSVAISQIMSSDFDDSDATKRKMLMFTNSVQDAAHQAGFYESRTFRFLFRQSIQHYLKTQDRSLTLAELQEGFKKYWKEHLDKDEYYYRFLSADLSARIDLNRNYRDGHGGFLDIFKKEFDLRVDWEICSEFGLTALLGRTLEKTGTSGTFFDNDKMTSVSKSMGKWLKDNKLKFIDHSSLAHFINGILHRMRVRGGIDHPYLDQFRTGGLKPYEFNWNFSKEHFLNKKFSTSSRYPKLLATSIGGRAEIIDVTEVINNRNNWFYIYFKKSFEPLRKFGDTEIYPNLVNDFYIELFNVLEDVGFVNKKRSRNGVETYAITPDSIWIEPKVKHIKCDKCQSIQYVAESDTLTQGMHCLDYKCDDGRYNEITTPEFNYYQSVYNRKVSPRIYASEHTGLLERNEREYVERDFKEHPNFNSINALCATSTLEMGIDIGDLNVMGNSNIPPKPSNFLQRVGRAGRKSGSALVLNYAHTGTRHDMFYYSEPLEMMEGEVQTPGCFLEAKDILRRHFYAYCIDSWVSANTVNRLPNKISDLNLKESSLVDENFFLNKIRTYIQNNKEWLVGRFGKKYPDKTRPVLDILFENVSNGNFFLLIEDEFKKLADHLQSLRTERDTLDKRKKELQHNDPEIDTIDEQLRGIKAQQGLLLRQSVVEYMTNAGLLPNYAFPETGVKLEATVYTRKAQGDDPQNTIEPKPYEVVRPASQGIKELAPGNFFYTHKSRLLVSGLGIFGWRDNVQKFRFCGNCDCIADETMPEYKEMQCPKCKDDSWGANEHYYMKFNTSRSSENREDAALDDGKDERQKERYYVMKHFNFKNSGNVLSYGMKKVGFGIEFCKDMDIMEVNYGYQSLFQQRTKVNGNNNIPELGFVVCKDCGKTIWNNPGNTKQEDLHYRFCKHKDVPYPPGRDDPKVFENIYLYRKMSTESIKVLLPVQLVDTQSSIVMFKAGIELGMRYYYQSSPDHIKIDTYREYNEATQNFDNYLVIYDSIPGGTGYLSKLYDTKEFSKLLEIAYVRIRDCECKSEGKDGCYHCILTYGNQMGIEKLSRSKAELLFEKVVENLDQWETIEGSIGTITKSGVIEDSELELQFINLLSAVASKNNWKFEKVIDVDRYFYELFIKKDNVEVKYSIRPQYKLGSRDGIEYYTVADFQFICNYAKLNDAEIPVSEVPQWAVYLDGYTYHATGDTMRFYGDFKKREAIRNANHALMYSWTLTWDDMAIADLPGNDNPGADDLYIQDGESHIGGCKNSFERFIQILSTPKLSMVKLNVFNYILDKCTDIDCACPYDKIDEALHMDDPSQMIELISEEDRENEHFFGKTRFIPTNGNLTKGSLWYAQDFYPEDINDESLLMTSFDRYVRYDWRLNKGLQSIDKIEWEKFWRRYDLLQFFDEAPSAEEQQIDYDEVLMYYPGLETIVTQLLDNGIYFNQDGGFSLEDADGVMIAEADLGFLDKKIVINPLDEISREAFVNAGYTIVSPDEFNIDMVK